MGAVRALARRFLRNRGNHYVVMRDLEAEPTYLVTVMGAKGPWLPESDPREWVPAIDIPRTDIPELARVLQNDLFRDDPEDEDGG